MKHGFNVKVALFFCNSFTTPPVVWQSVYFFNYYNYINQNYGRGNKHISIYSNILDNMLDQGVPSYPSKNPPLHLEQSTTEKYPNQDGYPSYDAPQNHTKFFS